MDGTIKDELYSEALRFSNLDLGVRPGTNNGNHNAHDDLWYDDDDDDGSSCVPSKAADRSSDLDREWQRRHDQFHTIGYRDGLIAGKESSAQEGFNAGFVESVYAGYNWGVVKGVIGTLACLPPELQEKLITTEESRIKFQKLHESVQPVSTADALKTFHESLSKRSVNQGETVESSSCVIESHNHKSEDGFQNYQSEFESLISKLPLVKLNSDSNQ
nr:protein yae1-like isoform X4 [Ipomoea batatas]